MTDGFHAVDYMAVLIVQPDPRGLVGPFQLDQDSNDQLYLRNHSLYHLLLILHTPVWILQPLIQLPAHIIHDLLD